MHKYRYVTVTVETDVDVDLDDVMDELDDDDLMAELEKRNMCIPSSLKRMLETWLQKTGRPNLWALSDDELCRMILTEIHK